MQPSALHQLSWMLSAALKLDPVAPFYGALCVYSTSASLTVAYNVGALAGTFYAMQMASGIVIAMSYEASSAGAFMSLDR